MIRCIGTIFILLWASGRAFAFPVPVNSFVGSVYQEEVIDGPGAPASDAREFDLSEDDFVEQEKDPMARRRVELILGVIFLLLVICVAFWRRGAR